LETYKAVDRISIGKSNLAKEKMCFYPTVHIMKHRKMDNTGYDLTKKISSIEKVDASIFIELEYCKTWIKTS